MASDAQLATGAEPHHFPAAGTPLGLFPGTPYANLFPTQAEVLSAF